MKTKNIGFIGGGNMASALINGLIASGHPADRIWVTDINKDTLRMLQAAAHVRATVHLEEAVAPSDVIIFAVKPQVLAGVAGNTAALLQTAKTLVISIAAGISQKSLSGWLGDKTPIIRCMPNTPALVRTGASALHANDNVTPEQRDLAENILRSVGLTIWAEDEAQLDAVTAVSGSGPAYFFLLMEAMESAAVKMGLSHEHARLLVQQTALGAAKIALESAESPAQLRQRVTSPGGTTQQAIATFQQGGFEKLVADALHAARNRSIELSQQAENL